MFLGGFLGALSVFRNVDRLNGKPQLFIPLAILMRILRIWPMMMFVTAIQWQWQDQLPYGYNVWQRSFQTDNCNDGWWQILLTASPIGSNRCMPVLWYIQVCYVTVAMMSQAVVVFDILKENDLILHLSDGHLFSMKMSPQ